MKQEKKCVTCKKTKPLVTEFQKNKANKDGYRGQCRVCVTCARAKNISQKKEATRDRVFTENEKTIFQFGVSVGEQRCRDLQKAINIQMNANRRLFEIIREQDNRDLEVLRGIST